MVPFYQHLLTGQEMRFSGVKTMGRGFYRVRLYFLSPCYEFESHLASQTFTAVNVNSLKGMLELASILKEHQEVLVLFQYAFI